MFEIDLVNWIPAIKVGVNLFCVFRHVQEGWGLKRKDGE